MQQGDRACAELTARPVMRGSYQLHLLQHRAPMVPCLLRKTMRAGSTSCSQSGSASAPGTIMSLFAAIAPFDDDTVPADSSVAAAGQDSSPPHVL